MCGHLSVLSVGQLRFHGLRLLGYLALASLLFFLKDSVIKLNQLQKFESYLALILAVFLIHIGLRVLIKGKNYQFGFLNKFKFLNKFFSKNLGITVAFMPCSWLWVFLFISLQQSSILEAAAVVFFFWLGTLPLLILLNFYKGIFGHKIDTKVTTRIVGLFFIFLGLWQLQSKYLHIDHNFFQNKFIDNILKSLEVKSENKIYCAPLEAE